MAATGSRKQQSRKHDGPTGRRTNRTVTNQCNIATCHIKDLKTERYAPMEDPTSTSEIHVDASTSEQSHLLREHSTSAASKGESHNEDSSIWAFFCSDRNFRLYILSGLISHAGEWFAYIACVRFIEDISDEDETDGNVNEGGDGVGREASSSALAISILVILRLLPKMFFSALGGLLSDSTDRKRTMICLDTMSALMSLGYLGAIRSKSLLLMYAIVFGQEIIEALYLPSSEAMYPQLTPTSKLMEQGCVWTEGAYAVISAFGAGLGGFCVAWFGLQFCFVLDCCTGLTSAALLCLMSGEWAADSEDEDDSDCIEEDYQSVSPPDSNNEGAESSYCSMMVSGFNYIWNGSVFPFVFIKATGMLLYGAVEVIAVAFSEQNSGPNESSQRLGIIYTSYGLGCVFGPFVSNLCTDIERPRTLMLASAASFGLIAFSWGGLALIDSFVGICILMALSSLGAEILWLDSDLLILSHSKNQFLGRVSALDDSLSVSFEAFSALLAGLLQGQAHLSTDKVCWVFAAIGVLCAGIWALFITVHNKRNRPGE